MAVFHDQPEHHFSIKYTKIKRHLKIQSIVILEMLRPDYFFRQVLLFKAGRVGSLTQHLN